MKAPRFWWRRDRGAAAHCLAPIGAIVGTIAARRMASPPRVRLSIPVYCVGNPTVGGAGKTPIALAIAKVLAEAGAMPVFLTRGYGGSLKGPVTVGEHTASEVGDEALILAETAPTVVARDRGKGGVLAETLGTAVIMDDGFQNPALAKDWSALVVDAVVGLGNALVTPAGPMRAPLAAHLPQADALLFVGGVPDDQIATSLPLHPVTVRQSIDPALKGAAVLAFAGIGRPEKFFAGLETEGVLVEEKVAFADHHPFTEGDAKALLAAANGRPVLTTAKDAVRLRGLDGARGELAARLTVIPVTAELDEALEASIRRVYEGSAPSPPEFVA
ncbi:MAG: tetraacyldisaccharide 4'-kinase [Pseudomonadota bacterium]